MTMNVGMIGFAGKQGQEHLATLHRMDGITVCGGVDSSADAESVAAEYGFPVFDSTEELLSGCAMDACFVAVPHYLHVDIAKKLLEGRVPVLKEKPLAMNELDARVLLRTSERTGTPVITLTQRAFRSDFLFAQRSLAALGEPVWFCYEYHANIPSSTSGWRAQREFAAGGVLLDMGYHALDVLTMWFGEAFEATGDMHYVYTSSQDEILEDIANVRLILTEGDCTGNLHVLRHSDRKHESFEVHCKGGMVRIDPRNAVVTVTRHGTVNQEVSRFTADKQAIGEGVLSEALKLIGRPDEWRDHLRRHVANVRLCELIYHESTHHRWRALDQGEALIGEANP